MKQPLNRVFIGGFYQEYSIKSMNTLWWIHRISFVIDLMLSLKYSSNLSKEKEKKLRTEFGMEFGKNLKKIRKEVGLTQEELAFKAGLHSTYVGHIETGIYIPSIFVIWKISKALKVKIDKLFFTL